MSEPANDSADPNVSSLQDLEHDQLEQLQHTIIAFADNAEPGTTIPDLANDIALFLEVEDAPTLPADAVVEEIKVVKRKRQLRRNRDTRQEVRRQQLLAQRAELDKAVNSAVTRHAKDAIMKKQATNRRKIDQALARLGRAEADTQLAVATADAVDAMLNMQADVSSEDSMSDSSSESENQENSGVNAARDEGDRSDNADMMPLGQRELAVYRRVAGRAIAKRKVDRDEVLTELKAYLRAVRHYFEYENEIRHPGHEIDEHEDIENMEDSQSDRIS